MFCLFSRHHHRGFTGTAQGRFIPLCNTESHRGHGGHRARKGGPILILITYSLSSLRRARIRPPPVHQHHGLNFEFVFIRVHSWLRFLLSFWCLVIGDLGTRPGPPPRQPPSNNRRSRKNPEQAGSASAPSGRTSPAGDRRASRPPPLPLPCSLSSPSRQAASEAVR